MNETKDEIDWETITPEELKARMSTNKDWDSMICESCQ